MAYHPKTLETPRGPRTAVGAQALEKLTTYEVQGDARLIGRKPKTDMTTSTHPPKKSAQIFEAVANGVQGLRGAAKEHQH